ncbi:MAG: hypothetical protein ACE3L7_02940 [Candidatus Pristimantibacillus sp.]
MFITDNLNISSSAEKVLYVIISIFEFIETWEKNHAEEQLGGFTLKNYISIINSQLIPEFGDSVISKIKTIDIVSYFTKLRSPDGHYTNQYILQSPLFLA